MPQNIGEFLTNRARRDSNLEAIYEHASGRRFLIRNSTVGQIR